MTPYERVINRLKGKPVDKIPNLNIIMTFAAKYTVVPYSQYVKNYNHLVEGNIRCCNDFGIDMLSTISDSYRELYDFGANIIFPEDEVPVCKDYFIKEYSDIKKLHIRDPLKSKRMLDRIKAIDLYKKRMDNYYPVLGWIEGSFAEATNLRGLTNIMIDIIDAPEFVFEILEISTGQAMKFGIEQIKAGADFIGIGDSSASLIGPSHYKNYVLPYEKKLIKCFHDLGAKVKLHICGDISNILEFVYQSEADIIDIDWMVDFSTAIKIFAGKTAVCGNFDPVKIMLNGTTGEVEKVVKKLIELCNNNTFIAAGCEVPKNTPIKNMLKVDETLRRFS